MTNWYLFPWTLQYLISGFIIIVITVYILRKNPKSLVYRSFFLFGLCTAVWEIFAFLHRNAPNAVLSKNFLIIDFIFLTLVPAFLLLSVIYMDDKRKEHVWVVLPALLMGLIYVFNAPFEPRWTAHGWSYALELNDVLDYLIFVNLVYLAAVIVILFHHIRKSTLYSFKKKYRIILFGFTVFYVVGTVAANLVLQKYHSIPPTGGIFTFITFIFISYAILIPTENISPKGVFKKPSAGLTNAYLRFLNKFRSKMPGNELGESSFRFKDYLESMDLNEVVTIKGEKLVFDQEVLKTKDMTQLPDAVLRAIKNLGWSEKVSYEFSDIFVRTYELIKKESRREADIWLKWMTYHHGGYLFRYKLLDGLSNDVTIPSFFNQLNPGCVYLYKEERPERAYNKLKDAKENGLQTMAISKLDPEIVKRRYRAISDEFLKITFDKKGEGIDPKKLNILKKIIMDFIDEPGSNLVVMDSLDQLIFANGLERTSEFIKQLHKKNKEHGSILLISIDPSLISAPDISGIEKHCNEVK